MTLMVTGLTQRVSGWLSVREFFALVVPCLLFWAVVALLLLHRFGASAAHHWWTVQDPSVRIAVGAAVINSRRACTLVRRDRGAPRGRRTGPGRSAGVAVRG
ncbi:hypothetical protein ACFWWT_45815 [Streptomyces sp. NPDC058676]|uniref:hypothetical protein n=1 Tax=unclassified Streptomyces TaxID=2593676 RepID=UPI00365A75BF